ncbi:MAG TPA: hypothetical protein VMT66_14205 [Steroidobacteraceae bacterium]|nr:hypothetical protein [Steroidobacteraceae bacterium]
MAAILVLLIALFAPLAARAAPPAACESFSRSSPSLPELVRDWFVHSTDERVAMCPKPAAAGEQTRDLQYFGEGLVRQQGAVCSYHSHGLTLIGSGTRARLERYERSEALDMTLAGGAECPPPHAATGAAAYVETYDVSSSAFLGIMRLWSATASGLGDAAAAAETVRIAPDARAQLEVALTPERARRATVTRIVRIPGRALRQRYALFLTAPTATGADPAQYVIYLDKSLRKPFEITAFSETD